MSPVRNVTYLSGRAETFRFKASPLPEADGNLVRKDSSRSARDSGDGKSICGGDRDSHPAALLDRQLTAFGGGRIDRQGGTVG
ncbi:hypothetical protein [Rhizobium bangladeshense]|uniref:hypothetical protein n=1 Tax=Rhizobium bangladeshense TaxID=1138189 RepID=UPI001A982E6F|nr:hypothetical protein [Rhizobium bangladeshense]MBX4891142.1 hypothetical protein [Rhizobium bangladeshense]MBX4934716.1 hypothetical protein [Rhizobium bangladeshense]MBY3582750.1 hypothetical protein [Rhizobium bangladeshense]QSY91094.1 hypothetical protein J2J98_21330 [Rhizobium bangladeshense]